MIKDKKWVDHILKLMRWFFHHSDETSQKWWISIKRKNERVNANKYFLTNSKLEVRDDMAKDFGIHPPWLPTHLTDHWTDHSFIKYVYNEKLKYTVSDIG